MPSESAAPEMVACNAETGHQPHDWTFADDYPLMRCPGVECHVRRADPLDVDGPCPACHGPLRWHRPMEAIRA